jgi:hypothetical protein
VFLRPGIRRFQKRPHFRQRRAGEVAARFRHRQGIPPGGQTIEYIGMIGSKREPTFLTEIGNSPNSSDGGQKNVVLKLVWTFRCKVVSIKYVF